MQHILEEWWKRWSTIHCTPSCFYSWYFAFGCSLSFILWRIGAVCPSAQAHENCSRDCIFTSSCQILCFSKDVQPKRQRCPHPVFTATVVRAAPWHIHMQSWSTDSCPLGNRMPLLQSFINLSCLVEPLGLRQNIFSQQGPDSGQISYILLLKDMILM